MRTKVLIASLALAFMAAGAAAQNQSQNAVEANPGLIGPSSPVYGLEVAWDNAAMDIGLKNAGSVAKERAAEARAAMRNNNPEAAQKAAQNLQQVAERAKSGDVQGLDQAMAIMEETIANAPNEQARQGMRTALQNMKEARQRQEEARNQGQSRGNRTDREQGDQGQQPQNRSGSQDGREGNSTGGDPSDAGEQGSGGPAY